MPPHRRRSKGGSSFALPSRSIAAMADRDIDEVRKIIDLIGFERTHSDAEHIAPQCYVCERFARGHAPHVEDPREVVCGTCLLSARTRRMALDFNVPDVAEKVFSPTERRRYAEVTAWKLAAPLRASEQYKLTRLRPRGK